MIRRRLYFILVPLTWGRTPMPSNVCRVCNTNYPVSHKYVKCLICGASTKYDISARTMPPVELAELKKDYLPPSDEDIKAARVEAERQYDIVYLYAEKEAARRNLIGGTWCPEDVLEELLDHNARAA